MITSSTNPDCKLSSPFYPRLSPTVRASPGIFAEVVAEGVAVTGSDLINYIDPFELREAEAKDVQSAALRVKEVQAVLLIANDFQIPICYGGPAPLVAGSVVLDLHRMNRIVKVSEQYSYAVVEPGVTFFDLYNHCRKEIPRFGPMCRPSAGALDCGFGYTPMGDHHQQICGIEVALANGEVVRTGQFAMNYSKTAHLSKLSFGSSIEGQFLQSNLGVVTKLGIWMLPQPQTFMSCTLDMDEPEDIAMLVDTLGALRHQEILQNSPVIRNLIA
ncbi:hypothetical protein BJX68DRAFT_272891 [Aspergillus pseudodeflectus]|uniref:FAD linked oxidase N-terminal domain-containing protein n=1 Tax=Aspergillus pseudodeflectus TaxID=176178 RepID=A0ABR4JF91_9EURO